MSKEKPGTRPEVATVATQGVAGPEIEMWRWAWRIGFAPVMPLGGLRCLLLALERDDPALIQDRTCLPSPVYHSCHKLPVEGACAVGYCGVTVLGGFKQPPGKEDPSAPPVCTVGMVEAWFATAITAADALMDRARPETHLIGQTRHFLNWFDDTPRAEVIAALVPEVRLAIANKEAEGVEARA